MQFKWMEWHGWSGTLAPRMEMGRKARAWMGRKARVAMGRKARVFRNGPKGPSGADACAFATQYNGYDFEIADDDKLEVATALFVDESTAAPGAAAPAVAAPASTTVVATTAATTATNEHRCSGSGCSHSLSANVPLPCIGELLGQSQPDFVWFSRSPHAQAEAAAHRSQLVTCPCCTSILACCQTPKNWRCGVRLSHP